MTSADPGDGIPSQKRYRLPGIEREGIAELSVIETALWPLRGGTLPTSIYETSYAFMAEGAKQSSHVRVFAPQGLQSIDEYILWGLLGISLNSDPPQPTLLATPYWMMKRLGMDTGGFQYDQLRASLERLALVAYQNTGFYNPLSQQHERVTLHFLASFLPTKGKGGDVVSDRAWRIEWGSHFFDMARATGGNLLFDLDLYRALTPASRRLFLKLKDRFWRTKRVFMNVDDLTINGLGFSADRPLYKRKYDLTTCLRELLEHRIIELGRGQTDPGELFRRASKGCYVVVFYEGEYFRQPLAGRTTRQKNAIFDDPLYEPLKTIGVDVAGIRRLFKEHARSRIQQWIRITDAAVHEKPEGFPGFKRTAAAFLMDGIQQNRMPPDWIYTHEKRQHQKRWEEDRMRSGLQERELRDLYQHERSAALQSFIDAADGQAHWQTAYEAFLTFYRSAGHDRPWEAARDAATGKVERDQFQFPDFGTWLLMRERTQD